MIIVAGTITLHPGRCAAFLEASTESIREARRAPGCQAFVVAADPIEPDVANVYEVWDSEAALLSFRGEGPGTDMRDMIAGANVLRYYVSHSDRA